MTGNRIRDSKRNPFFQVKVKDGKYSTENQVSYYGKKLPDDTFSFDISNQKVQANLDEFGTIRHITFFHGNYLMESKPGAVSYTHLDVYKRQVSRFVQKTF